MKKLSTYLTNFIAPSAGFSEGQIKDDPGDSTGSGAVAQTVNDMWYGLVAFAKKYIGGISDTSESETASDIMDSIESLVGVKNENVSEYSGVTVYGEDDEVMYLGEQFVSMVAANTGNDPLDNPDKWLPCFNRSDALVKWRNGKDESGGFDPLHNFRDALYRPIFGFGKYNFGGDSVSGSGRNFQNTGLHLDGDVVTGDATLVALLDVGGANEYHHLDVIAPDIVGTRTLLDVRGRVGRVVDAIAGDTEDVGVAQEDAFQGHWHNIQTISGTNNVWISAAEGTGVTLNGAGFSVGAIGTSPAMETTSPITDGVNGTPLTASETIVKNYTKGVSYILIMQEI